MEKNVQFIAVLLALGLAAIFYGCDGYDWDSEEGEISPGLVQETRETAPTKPTHIPTLIPPGTQENLAKWDLWSGDTPILRGANIHQRLVYLELDGEDYMGPGPVGPPFTQQDFDDLAALGANWVNISHPGLYTENAPFEPNSGVIENLDRLLQMIENADMFAVISFRTGPGRSEFTFYDPWYPTHYLNETVWTDPEAQDSWVQMWQFTAERYQDNAIVVGYDLMVEPNAEYVCCEIEGEPDAFYPEHAGEIYDWNVFYPRIVEGIRAVDTNIPIIVGGMGMSHASYLPYIVPVDDRRTLYAIHQYQPIEYTHQEIGSFGGGLNVEYPGQVDYDWDGVPDTFDIHLLEEILYPVDAFIAEHNVPVTSNEFGLMRYEPGAAQYIKDQISLFETRGINHAIWEWSPAWLPLREDQQEFAFRLGTDPDKYTDDTSSDLLDAIQGYWGLNSIRPSNVTFID